MKFNILIIDDEAKVLESLKRSLYQEPYRVFTADSAKEAIKIANKENIDVIISDHDMPHISGAELLSMFKTELPNTVRIMLTGKGDYHTALKCINSADVFRFLTKPCSSTEITMAIRQALDHSSFINKIQHLLHSYSENKRQLGWIRENHPEAIEESQIKEEKYVPKSNVSQLELLSQLNRILN